MCIGTLTSLISSESSKLVRISTRREINVKLPSNMEPTSNSATKLKKNIPR